MKTVQLNLSRKLRSKQFDQIIGQQLSVRILKNSLYRDHYFPVYLFAGQKGCGKTTTARVFAAAVNCEQLSAFQKDPRNATVPCLTCPSCTALFSGKHPDFIEIDAASHTGVDNVRQIIEASSLLPLMGCKKIYLIDEAHMLSKAAFNAFLKILEEPPASVLFILATTDPQKIISTVTSRCFKILFKPVDEKPLVAYLQQVCSAEKIAFDDDGISLIVKQTEGSVRDALNLLEQVRFASQRVTKSAVLAVLGSLDDQQVLNLFDVLVHKGPVEVLEVMKQINVHTCAADMLLKKLLCCIRLALWLKHGVTPSEAEMESDRVHSISKDCSVERLTQMLMLLYQNEEIFKKTTAQHAFLELLCLQLCQGASSSPKVTVATTSVQSSSDKPVTGVPVTGWPAFLNEVTQLKDPLVASIFQQGRFVQFAEGKLEVAFSKDNQFFGQWFNDAHSLWQPLLDKTFGGSVTFIPQFVDPSKTLRQAQGDRASGKSFTPQARAISQKTQRGAKESAVDVSDKEKWQKTHTILNSFDGTISEVQDDAS